ncbi:pilus assembly protein PilM, partial [Candidatus Falkowbacteria bacterium]|nr:pilus assembly protein PilM [Candidatus Falkowbacteria bacterium]
PSQMQFDYTIVNLESYQALKDEDEIRDAKFLITAAGTDIVREYTQVFAKAGLELLSLDIESFAMIRSVVGNDKSLVMTVDFGDKATNLSMIESGVPVLNRSVEVGGQTVTQNLASLMNITLAQAEQYKIDLPILMQQQQLTAMPKPIAESIQPVLNEIKFLIQTYYKQVDASKKLDRIMLTGGGALLAGLRGHIEAQTDTRTYIADPWARVIYPAELEKILKELGPKYAIALGLAMTKIR